MKIIFKTNQIFYKIKTFNFGFHIFNDFFWIFPKIFKNFGNFRFLRQNVGNFSKFSLKIKTFSEKIWKKFRFFSRFFFVTKKIFFENNFHLYRSEISPRFQKSHLENSASSQPPCGGRKVQNRLKIPIFWVALHMVTTANIN